MFKLFLISAAVIPVAIIPWLNSSASTVAVDAEWIDDDEPAVSRLEVCKDAEMSIFFKDIYITTPSAEYILEGVQALSNCKNITFEIIPLIEEGAEENDVKHSLRQAQELKDYIAITGFDASISKKFIEDDYNAGNSWRGALLKIAASS